VGEDDDWSRLARIAKRPVGHHTCPRRSCAPTSSFASILLEALPPIGPRHSQFATATCGTIRAQDQRAGTPERALDQDRHGLGPPLPGRASPRPLVSAPHRLVSALAYNHGPDHWRSPYNENAVLWPSALSKRYRRVVPPASLLRSPGWRSARPDGGPSLRLRAQAACGPMRSLQMTAASNSSSWFVAESCPSTSSVIYWTLSRWLANLGTAASHCYRT
jgi:hypothetical protein